MIHVGLNVRVIRLDVFHNLVLDGPLEEIQLPDRSLHVFLMIVRYRYAVPTTKRIKPPFRIRFQFQFVLIVHFEANGVFAVAVGYGERIHCIVLFRIISDKPVDDAERNLRFPIDDPHHFVEIPAILVELHQILEQQFILSMIRWTIRHGGYWIVSAFFFYIVFSREMLFVRIKNNVYTATVLIRAVSWMMTLPATSVLVTRYKGAY